MDAPLYQPARKFEPPRVLSQEPNTTTMSLSTLVADPEAKAILLAEAPAMKFVIGSEEFRPYLDNMPLRPLTKLNMVQPGEVDRVEAKLQALSAKRRGEK
ncbi:hypothetical protein [Novosphingobium sp. Chol11]|uniref:hypothetical protein n=1 Tax=Novosphingobium sp. Chol11 TaxID=1385763 RepID=UPI001142F641|nr:hypothetical protein [Novosphingobium sp. Chol11]